MPTNCLQNRPCATLTKVSRQTVRQAPEHLVELGLVENLCPVPITSLTHDTQKMGGIAAQLLLDQMAGKPVHSSSISWKLVQKASS